MSQILIAEDAESIAQMLKEILEHSDFQVVDIAKMAIIGYRKVQTSQARCVKIVVCSPLGMETIIGEAKKQGERLHS